MRRGYSRKIDENQPDLVKALRNLGVSVHVLNDVCDLLCQHGGITMLAEVRPERKPKEARRGRQERFQKEFSVYWLSTAEDCVALAQTLRVWHQAVSGK